MYALLRLASFLCAGSSHSSHDFGVSLLSSSVAEEEVSATVHRSLADVKQMLFSAKLEHDRAEAQLTRELAEREEESHHLKKSPPASMRPLPVPSAGGAGVVAHKVQPVAAKATVMQGMQS
jgi:hypothetical protein